MVRLRILSRAPTLALDPPYLYVGRCQLRPRSIALLFAVGVFLGQLAWISAIPPYRGIDEFDHVYRAASVAEGYWGPGVGTSRAGRGNLVPVPQKIVTAGSEICRSYAYTGRDNCRPVTDWDDELVTVASAASRYNPAFYWLIGTPSRLAQGAEAVYVMRVVASLACALLVGLAAWATALWSRTRWPLAALALTLTPVVVYSLAVPAPNGIEMAGALCVWCSLIGLSRVAERRATSALLTVATVGAIPLILVRPLGPMWLVLSLAALLVTLGWKSVYDESHRLPFGTSTSLLLVALVTALSSWWTVATRPATLEDANLEAINPWLSAIREVPLWFLQSIAAFPTRNEPAPAVVYAASAVTFAAMFTWAIVRANHRLRLGLVLICLMSVAVPFAFTLATVQTTGTIWQGRYTLPLSFGVVLVAGLALERARATSRLAPALLKVFGITTAVAHVVSVVNVQHTESNSSPLAGDARWISAPLWVVGALAAASVACWVVAIVRGRPLLWGDQAEDSLTTRRLDYRSR